MSPYNMYVKAFDFFDSEREIIEILTRFLVEIFNSKLETINILYNYNGLEDLLINGFFTNDNNLLKQSLYSFMHTVFLNPIYSQNRDLDPRFRLGKLMILDLLKKTQYIDNSDNRLSVFFHCYRNLFENLDLNFFEDNKIIKINDIFDFMYEILSAKKACSAHLSIEILCLLVIFLGKRKSFISYYVKNYDLIQLLSKNFIFSQEKNKHQSIFEQVINVLLIICQNSFDHLEEFLNIFNEKMKEGLWRSDKKNSWEFHPNFKDKSSTGYVGLKNLGCSNHHF